MEEGEKQIAPKKTSFAKIPWKGGSNTGAPLFRGVFQDDTDTGMQV